MRPAAGIRQKSKGTRIKHEWSLHTTNMSVFLYGTVALPLVPSSCSHQGRRSAAGFEGTNEMASNGSWRRDSTAEGGGRGAVRQGPAEGLAEG